jgi:hypothetical protein
VESNFWCINVAVTSTQHGKLIPSNYGTTVCPAELIKGGGRSILSEIHKLFNSIWNQEKWPEEWKESIIVPIYKKGDKTDCSNYTGISL